MLLRHDDDGVLAIGQASHAWLAGQLARAWGNEEFGSVEPWEDVCLAAEQHDVGMAAWDLEPSYDERTGLPHAFLDMPLEVHLRLWLEGPPRLVSQSAYAALLVSMHGWRLYSRRDLDRSPPADAQRIREFLAAQVAFQERLVTLLDHDPQRSEALARPVRERNSLLIWTWDYLSLALCLDWAPATAKRAPTREGAVDLEITGDGERTFELQPWPFQAESVRLRCEGRRLPERFKDDADMRRGLADAPIESLELVLHRRA
jgi:hypothetical protein